MQEQIDAYRQFLDEFEAAMYSRRCFHVEVCRWEHRDSPWVVVHDLDRYGLGWRLRVVYTC